MFGDIRGVVRGDKIQKASGTGLVFVLGSEVAAFDLYLAFVVGTDAVGTVIHAGSASLS